MKRKLGVCIILVAIIINAGLLTFAFNLKKQADEQIINNTADFLEFEKAIIELNEDTTDEINQNDTPNMKDKSSIINEQIHNNTDENRFGLKRLIIKGNIKSNYNANKVISYNDLNILSYNSEKMAKQAYEELIKDKSISVMIDEMTTTSQYAEKEYDYTTNQNWGTKATDISGYRQFLVDNNINKEVVVVVLDTGINTSHEAFKNRLLKTKDGKIQGYSYYDSTYRYSYNNLAFDVDNPSTLDIDESDTNKYSFEDDNGHGSHVAGILTNLTPENVKILPIKVGNNKGKSSTSILMSAYLRIINIYSKQFNIVATNLSFTGGGKTNEKNRDTFNNECYNVLRELNILSVTAAGNDNHENNLEGLNAIVVSSLKQYNNEYRFDNNYSNYGKIIDISAPGTDIISADISDSDQPSNSYVSLSGTSMATPHVTGIVALLYLNPNLPNDYTVTDIENMLYENAIDLGQEGKDIYYGAGIANLKYFETVDNGKLNFYKNNSLVTYYEEDENFTDPFILEMRSTNPEYEIIYNIDGTLPTYENHIKYTAPIEVNKTTKVYAMGVKIIDGKIVEKTDIYHRNYFYEYTPIEECFNFDSYTYKLTNYIGNYKNLTIPNKIHGKKVKSLDKNLFKNSKLESIILPNTITSIGTYAFANSKNLKYVYAPGVKTIYMGAFYDCDSLTIVNNVDLGYGAFLPSLETTRGYAFTKSDNIKKVSLPKLKNLGSFGYDFSDCSSLYDTYLPSITSIPKGTFENSNNLAGEFLIEENVSSISNNAFAGTNIYKFIIDKNNKHLYTDGKGIYSKTSFITYAPSSNFDSYKILDTVTIDNTEYTITSILSYAIYGNSFNYLYIPKSISLIESHAFYKGYIQHLHYDAANVTDKGYYIDEILYYPAFCKISTLELGENVKRIPANLFMKTQYDTIIINSDDTLLETDSLNASNPANNLKIIFNFDIFDPQNYFNNVFKETGISILGSIQEVYTKNRIDYIVLKNDTKLQYLEQKNEYYVYGFNKSSPTYRITTILNGNGTISQKNNEYFTPGESMTYIVIPDIGYKVESIILDGQTLNTTQLNDAIQHGIIFNNINQNHTIIVKFAKQKTVSYQASGIVDSELINSKSYKPNIVETMHP